MTEQTETMTPEAAEAAIDAKLRDADFGKRYYNEFADGHSESVQELASLYAAANGEAAPEPPPVREPVARRLEAEKPDGEVEPKKSDAEIDAEQERAKLEGVLAKHLGEGFEQRMQKAREWAGPELVNAVIDAGYGDDADTIVQLVQIAESDPEGVLAATTRRLYSQGVYYGAATRAIRERHADPEFRAAYHDASHIRHADTVHEMSALSILERPPKFLVAAMEELNRAQSQSPART